MARHFPEIGSTRDVSRGLASGRPSRSCMATSGAPTSSSMTRSNGLTESSTLRRLTSATPRGLRRSVSCRTHVHERRSDCLRAAASRCPPRNARGARFVVVGAARVSGAGAAAGVGDGEPQQEAGARFPLGDEVVELADLPQLPAVRQVGGLALGHAGADDHTSRAPTVWSAVPWSGSLPIRHAAPRDLRDEPAHGRQMSTAYGQLVPPGNAHHGALVAPKDPGDVAMRYPIGAMHLNPHVSELGDGVANRIRITPAPSVVTALT